MAAMTRWTLNLYHWQTTTEQGNCYCLRFATSSLKLTVYSLAYKELARHTQATGTMSTGSAIRSGEETDTGRDISAGRSRSSKPTKRARASSVGSSASVASTASRSSKGKGSSKKQLKLRDWSDVLGMAALTGWNPEVIQRAAERCSKPLWRGNVVSKV